MDDLLKFLTAGNHLGAVGAALVIIVGLSRSGLAKWKPWFASQTGGYVLAWGSTSLLYVGTALEQGTLPTLQLLETALATGFAASGIFTHWQDIKVAAKKVPPAAGAVALVFLVLLCTGMTSCGGSTPKPIQDALDCTSKDQTVLAAAEGECLKHVPDWGAVESCAISAAEKGGWDIGACVVSDLVQQYLMSKGAAQGSQSQAQGARDLLEKVRKAHADGRSIHTRYGNL